MGKSLIRIGNAGGYWGDDPEALARQVAGGELDYISMDFLAEITMSILQKQKARDPQLGYAKDFLPMLQSVLPQVLKSKTRIITNAGGISPRACATQIGLLAKSMGLSVRVAVVDGDDILPQLSHLVQKGCAFTNMETGQEFTSIQDDICSANIYFGALPVVRALEMNPDIIVTGRVTDTGITLAPMIHEFSWQLDDWNKLASGVVAGHILECGSQSTGGNFTDWKKVKDLNHIGYPIVEVESSGDFTVTKHPGTGGMVSVDTVREQLFYEMGNPEEYLTPDCVANFASMKLQAVGDNRVRVSEVTGTEPTPFYKVSMAYAEGFKITGSIVVSGPDARHKAQAFAEIFWQRFSGVELEKNTEYFGWNACHQSLVGRDDGNEILLRLSARSADKSVLQKFGKLVPSLILSGPPGVAVTGGVPRPQEVISYWPALMDKTKVLPNIALFIDGDQTEQRQLEEVLSGQYQSRSVVPDDVALSVSRPLSEVLSQTGQRLVTICLARSGDKGDTANIGVIARSPQAFAFVKQHLTAQVVKDMFQEFCHGKVERFVLPNLQGLNFLLEQSLGGGGTKTLRIDAQGKTFAQALLNQKFTVDAETIQSVARQD